MFSLKIKKILFILFIYIFLYFYIKFYDFILNYYLNNYLTKNSIFLNKYFFINNKRNIFFFYYKFINLYIYNNYFYLMLKTYLILILFIISQFFLTFLTIISRVAGPRYRLDQFINTTWKQFFVHLIFLIIIILLVSWI